MHLGTIALALLLLAPPLVAGAQQAGKMPMVGYLLTGPRECAPRSRDEAFYQGLRDLGYIRGQNITVDKRCYLTADQARKVLSEFVDRKVDVIVVGVPETAMAARAATRDIPIVCVGPVAIRSRTASWPVWLGREETSPGWRASRRNSSGSGSSS